MIDYRHSKSDKSNTLSTRGMVYRLRLPISEEIPIKCSLWNETKQNKTRGISFEKRVPNLSSSWTIQLETSKTISKTVHNMRKTGHHLRQSRCGKILGKVLPGIRMKLTKTKWSSFFQMPRTYTPSKSSRLLSSSRACRVLERAQITNKKKRTKRVPRVKLDVPPSAEIVAVKEIKSTEHNDSDVKPSTNTVEALETPQSDHVAYTDTIGKRKTKPRMSFSLQRLNAIGRRYKVNAIVKKQLPEGKYQVQQILARDDERCLVKWHDEDELTWEPYSTIPRFFRKLYEQQGSISIHEYCAFLDI